MKRGTRVTLTQDHPPYNAGQTGTAGGQPSPGMVIVEFDGYEEARAKNQAQKAKLGEDFNVVPWLAEIPLEKLTETPTC